VKKNITIIALIAVLAAILLYFIVHEPKPTDGHRDDHADVIATNDTLNAHDLIAARIIDSLKKDNRALDSVNKSLVKGQAQTERKLNAKASEVKTLVEQIRSYNQDTGYFGHLLDSLQQQVESLSFLLVQYEQYADSINNVNAAQKGNCDAIILEKDKRYNELKSAYDKLLKAYKELFDDYAKNQKTVRRERLKTKIAALLALIGGAAAIIK
jgi:DNA repair exonuclease SbcCD ATPase subunit